MPDIGKVLKQEIARLARKQAKAQIADVKRDAVRLKKSVAELKRQVSALTRENRRLAQEVMPVVRSQTAAAVAKTAPTMRITSRTVRTLRRKLGLSQANLAALLGVTSQSVVNWEGGKGRLRLRSRTLTALASVRDIGRREAKRRLAALSQSQGGKPGRKPRKKKAGPARKRGRLSAGKRRKRTAKRAKK